MNDVAATVVDAGLHRYLAAIGWTSTVPLVATCPVLLRDADDKAAETKASAIFVPIGAPGAPDGAGHRIDECREGRDPREVEGRGDDVRHLGDGVGKAGTPIARRARSEWRTA